MPDHRRKRPYRIIVQPWSQTAVVRPLAGAYAEPDRLAERVHATGATLTGIERLIVDTDGNSMQRPRAAAH